MTAKADSDPIGPEPLARLSRRDLLKHAGLVGTMALGPAAALAPDAEALAQAPAAQAAGAPVQVGTRVREALEALNATEADTLEAITARLIPSDEHGPGAAEARAAHYIDRALAGPLASFRPAYSAGLAAVDAYAQTSKGAPFSRLSTKDQDAVLTDMETNKATGFAPNSSTFFNVIRAHTIDGTFCDPYYGGNANFIGWDLIGYPGVRMAVTAEQQQIGSRISPNHMSAYDYPLFGKKQAAAGEHGGPAHGD
jgi:gluconate 2-dehydrogenase gamma chain